MSSFIDATELNRTQITIEKDSIILTGYDGYDSHSRLISVKLSKKTLKQLLKLIEQKIIK